MELIEEPQEVLSALREYVDLNTDTASEGGGLGYTEGFPPRLNDTSVKNQKTIEGGGKLAGERVTLTEEQYINDPSPGKLRAWIETQQNYCLIMLVKAEYKQIFQKQISVRRKV